MQKYMQRALELAAFGIGNVAPNPLVGCVIVHNEKIIGEGWHQKFGGPHAEVNAINSVNNKQLLAESTLYVTLEPCNHHGKTPPCVDLILQYKIPKVVIATLDVNPIVSGKGVARLKQNGVEVSFGILAQEAQFQNRRFITFHQKKRPYIILKWAQSADGFIDKKRETGEKGSFQISGKAAQIALHQWRSEEAGILVGKNTALIDNPKLNTRLWAGNNPVRIIIDTNLEVPRTHHIYDNSVRTFIFNRLETRAIFSTQLIQLDFTKPVIPKILEYAAYENIQSILVEGGAFTIQQFIQANLWDEARVISSLSNINDGLSAPSLPVKPTENLQIGKDSLEIFFNN
jgi:diaminohydroxyphosphoribosylaminopyrimidine deaminase / 5-amino-6-(5-phosphoribosylamino)uracil reductase